LQTRQPNASCFNFLTTAKKIEILLHPTNGTFAFALTRKAYPSAKTKEPFFSNAPFKIVIASKRMHLSRLIKLINQTIITSVHLQNNFKNITKNENNLNFCNALSSSTL
jgi:hypothetical protein